MSGDSDEHCRSDSTTDTVSDLECSSGRTCRNPSVFEAQALDDVEFTYTIYLTYIQPQYKQSEAYQQRGRRKLQL